LLSCVLITAVTLTAVDRVGREVSGSQNLVTTQGVVKAQVAQQSASAASASSASPVRPQLVITPTGVAATTKPPTTSPSVSRVSPKSSPTPAVTTTPPPPSPSPTPTIVLPTPPGIEYVYTCVDGKAVGGAVPPSSSPTATPTPTGSVSPTGSPSPSISLSPTPSGTTPSNSPTPSPSTGKIIETVPGGRIVIACLGNSIANASATTTDPGYTLTPRSLVNPRIDVFFSKN
jgi:hypothetical protein